MTPVAFVANVFMHSDDVTSEVFGYAKTTAAGPTQVRRNHFDTDVDAPTDADSTSQIAAFLFSSFCLP